MKPTARILPGLIVIALGFPVVATPAESWAQAAGSAFGRSAAPQSPAEARRQSDELLHRARLAMAENDLEAAAALVAQAEALGVDYGPLYLGDTPKKARHDLERRMESARTPSRPGHAFSPLSLGKPSAPPTDPFAGHNVAAAPTGTAAPSGVRQLPPVDQVTPMAPPAGGPDARGFGHPNAPGSSPTYRAAPATAAAHPNRPRSDKLLLEARRALALGDARTATAKVEEAKALGVPYGPGEDSPARVEAIISSYQDLLSQRAARGTTEAYRHQYARILMEQAQALLRWRDFDEAERLAQTAAQQYANFAPSEVSPQAFLERVAAERRRYQAMSGAAGGLETGAVGNGAPSLAAKQRAAHLVREARAALRSGDLRAAEDLARQAERLQIPDSYYAVGEDRPRQVLADVQRARLNGSNVVQASGQQVAPATGPAYADRQASHALYDPANDPTRNRLAADQQSGPVPPPQPMGPPSAPQRSVGMELFQQGEAALRAHQPDVALRLFRQAATHANELDPVTQQRLQDLLQMLSAPANGPVQGPPPSSMLDDAAAQQQVIARQVHAEVAHLEANAEKMRETDPKGALALLEQARQKVSAAGLEQGMRDQLLRRVDRRIAELQQYIEQNRPRIELDQRNRQIRAEIERERELTLETQEKLALMVEEFNQLMREQRFAEAEVVAKRAAELDPKNPLAQQLVLNAKFIRNYTNAMQIRSDKEQGVIDALAAVDESAIPINDMEPFRFGDVKHWEEITRRRSKWATENQRKLSERELEIEQKLRTPVMLQFDNAPLSQVLEYLAKLAEVNLHLDPQGLAEEGISSDTPVTINLSQEISLQSALNLILEPLHLSYVIKDEVLKITSEHMRSGEVYPVAYNVADLVIPIPNFTPSPNMGLAGAYHNGLTSAYNTSFGMGAGGSAPLAVLASKDGAGGSASINPSVLAQMSGAAAPGSSNMPMGFGPGGLSGTSGADFDSLIDLITSTIEPTSWDDVGGPGSIEGFETNLSLVVAQTQDVHEQIVDLLQQLRRLQDLQVTIEVRFITLNDNFFERIGVDFDFDINDKIDRPFQLFGRPMEDQDRGPLGPARNTEDQDFDRSVKVGLSGPVTGFGPALFQADLDIPFRQHSFGLAQPQFGGFDPSAGAQLGFAILSDIEAFFFIEAAQGDRRSNVLQAPKVTLFNGQQAFVSDTSQSPFVISVVPVVGDFAAAQQPVIVVLSEGTFLTVQAVVSADRRFVRLTLVPFFSKITDVNTFTFEGSDTTTSDSSEEGWVNPDDPDDGRREKSDEKKTTVRQGTTVQLPTFSFVTVTTTVSVPDGGTVLLGGIKRLSEGRNEFGVPMLNKIPYLNRLFKNVGIGRETQSLMMMVTPRIIIQEEEEELLGIVP